MFPLTKWVKTLLIANVAVFLVTAASPPLYRAMMLYPPWVVYRPWTVVTYMFLHAGLAHIFFNMLGLFFFGPRVEDRLGGKSFLWLYFLSGMGGAVFSLLFASQYPVVGASGAIFGVLLAFAMYWPREKIYLWMVLPVEAWLLVTIFVVGTLYMGVSGAAAGSGTAHFAHLGGLAFAFGYVKWLDWRRGAGRRAFQRAMSPVPAAKGGSDRSALARWRGISVEGLHQLNREEVERLLAKVEATGGSSLTDAERDFLNRMSLG
jgi:membrane associated rhomboid family serine protease